MISPTVKASPGAAVNGRRAASDVVLLVRAARTAAFAPAIKASADEQGLRLSGLTLPHRRWCALLAREAIYRAWSLVALSSLPPRVSPRAKTPSRPASPWRSGARRSGVTG